MIDDAFLIAILRNEKNGEYFITSQKEPRLNGAILGLSKRQQEKIEALHHILRIHNQIEDERDRLDQYERELFDKYLKFEFQKKEFPFLVDTSIFVKHIDRNTGIQYPTELPKAFLEGKITWQEALRILTA